MTVCIAAFSHNKKKIVTVSDMKVGFEYFSGDDLVVKTQPISKNWHLLVSGDAIDQVPFIVARAKTLLRKSKLDAGDVASCVYRALQERLHLQIEANVLKKYGFTTQMFNRFGKKRMTASLYNGLCTRIDKVRLSLKALVVGFDSQNKAHIIGVDAENAPTDYSDLGYWAIGIGANSALSALTFHAKKKHFGMYGDLADCVYCLCSAKFMAESEDVAESTFLTVLEADKPVNFITDLRIKEIREAWNRSGAPKVPAPILKKIPTMVHAIEDFRTLDPEKFSRIMGKSKKHMEKTRLFKEFIAIKRSLTQKTEEGN